MLTRIQLVRDLFLIAKIIRRVTLARRNTSSSSFDISAIPLALRKINKTVRLIMDINSQLNSLTLFLIINYCLVGKDPEEPD